MPNKELSIKKRFNKTLTVPDNLELTKVFVPDVPKDIIFPDQLNSYLRDQVQYLTHENGMLQKNLSEVETQLSDSNTKLSQLNLKLEEYTSVNSKNSFAGCTTAKFASGKIVELSKKLRERTSEIEVFKSKYSKLEQHVLNLEKSKIKETPEIPKPLNELEDQNKLLQDKLNTTSNKLFETRNANLQLKNELKVANKILQQEVGENLETLQTIMSTNKNWRGRAQIICDLQQKNNDLKEKLRTSQDDDKSGVKIGPIQLAKLERKLEELTKENCELQTTLGDTKKKFEALKARHKVVESESTTFRMKIHTLNEINDRNGELITVLKAQVAKAQDLQSEAVQKKDAAIQKLDIKNRDLIIEVSKQSCKIENHQVQVNELKREIELQKDKVKRGNVLSAKTFPTDLDTKTARQFEVERIRLLELTKISNERLESERVSHEATQSKFRIERQRVAKLEAKVQRMELDQRADQASTYSSYSTKSSLKSSDSNSEDRLQLAEETVKALQTRLEMERQEHKNDILQFSNILNNCNYLENSIQA